jgi:DNA-binding beta-propeller fold protein YncE
MGGIGTLSSLSDLQRNPDVKIGRYAFCALVVVSLAACGGGGGGNGGGMGTGGGTGSGSGTGTTYTVGGTISGLSASGLVLADNGGNNLTVSSGATTFVFPTPLQSGATYAVTVATQPIGETCTVASGTGTITANVASVAVTCKALYTIGGTVSGLSASGLVLADNGGDNLSVASGATSFTFATQLQSGAAYNVTVATQPTGETCAVAAGTGAGTATGNVSSVTIHCSVNTYTISGSISGLSNSGLQLRDYAGGETLSVPPGATQFHFATPVAYGTNVDVTVATQPFWESCSAGASNFSGPITSNITTDTFGCTAAVAAGTAVGTGVSYSNPAGVAVDTAGNLYVADFGSNTVYKISAAGAVSPLPFSGLSNPQGVAVNSSGSIVYVANTGASEILEDSGGTVTTFQSGYGFNQPQGVAVDSSGNVYVADTGNNRIEKFSTSGAVTILGSSYTFSGPASVAVDGSGNVYVTDTGSNKVVEISANNTVTTLPGTYSGPFGVAVDSAGDVYVTDTNDHEVKMITAQGNLATVAGSTTQGSCAASPPLFYQPYGIAVNGSGDLYVSDFLFNQVCELTPGP